MKRLLPAFLLLLVTHTRGQDIFKGYEHLFTKPLQYTAFKTHTAPVIDGRLQEAVWQNAPWTSYYIDIEGDKKPVPYRATRCKMLWDDDNLYIAAEMEEPHIWGYLHKRDQIIYNDNDFEIFIDPDNDTHHYFEIEINALNTIFDLYMSRPYRNAGKLRMDWNASNMKSAVYIEGTLNNPSDTDTKWTVEFAIPFSDLRLEDYVVAPPQKGTMWRINFSRVQWETDIQDGKYVRKKDSTGKRIPENNWVWSPQGVINMHYPERWGYLFFGDQEQTAFAVPAEEELKNYLWLIYYKQKAYRGKHKTYAGLLNLLNIPDTIPLHGKNYHLQMQGSDNSFFASINIGSVVLWNIDENGRVFSN